MRSAFLSLLFVTLLAASAAASESRPDPRFYESLRRLDPTTRLDQMCDYEAMQRIDQDPGPYHPDRAKAEVLSVPKRSKDTVIAHGAAFRSRGKWYAFSFVCKANTDRMVVTHFEYKIGSAIAEKDWPKYGLWR